jgi:pimeloyl-ACP methyl ester carboxylesterase
MDALGLPKATLAGYDWGGRAACIAAALWPQRTPATTSPRKPPWVRQRDPGAGRSSITNV